MKTKSVTDENLEILAQFKRLSAAYDALIAKKTEREIYLRTDSVCFRFDLSTEEADSILNKKLKELAVQIEKM